MIAVNPPFPPLPPPIFWTESSSSNKTPRKDYAAEAMAAEAEAQAQAEREDQARLRREADEAEAQRKAEQDGTRAMIRTPPLVFARDP